MVLEEQKKDLTNINRMLEEERDDYEKHEEDPLRMDGVGDDNQKIEQDPGNEENQASIKKLREEAKKREKANLGTPNNKKSDLRDRKGEESRARYDGRRNSNSAGRRYSEKKTKSETPCWNGNGCRFLKYGKCFYYHEEKEQKYSRDEEEKRKKKKDGESVQQTAARKNDENPGKQQRRPKEKCTNGKSCYWHRRNQCIFEHEGREEEKSRRRNEAEKPNWDRKETTNSRSKQTRQTERRTDSDHFSRRSGGRSSGPDNGEASDV